MAVEALKVVVTGGAGQIAYSLIPLIARGLVFGSSRRVQLRLLDIPSSEDALHGVAMEVQDSLFGDTLEGVLATIDDKEAFLGAEVAILLGGFPRKPGMERGDLIGKNAGIMKRMGEAMEQYAARSCKVLVVANPAPTNCFVLASYSPSIDRRNFSCLSRLDQDRMVGIMLEKANQRLHEAGGDPHGGGVPAVLRPSDVRGGCVWGNHSRSQVPDASKVEIRIDGRWVPVADVIGDDAWLSPSSHKGRGEDKGCLAEAVRSRGAEVLAARRLSSAMSAANAIAAHLSDWLNPSGSPRNSPAVSMGVFSEGNPYGVPEDLMCSFPVACSGSGDWEFAKDYRLGKEVSEQLWISIEELQEEKELAMYMLTGDKAEGARPASSAKDLDERPFSSL